VVGCGAMGSGIAEVCALAGLDVRVAVSSPESVRAGRERVLRSFELGVRRSRITSEQRDAGLAAIAFGTDLGELADRDLVVEAIREREADKVEVFAALGKILYPETVLATNTSSIPIMRLARASGRPAAVVGLHFFSPVPMMPLVEVVTCLLTEDETVRRAEEFVAGLGKRTIRAPDRAGFTVNALLIPYLLAAMRMVEAGHATPDSVDSAMVLGCGYPVGPLKLSDLVGLDVIAAVATALYEECKEPLYAPPPMLRRMVEGGLLGKKTGQGFFEYR
jgi:3-hydroxybutyryl-CoA dehydrogenase